MRCAWREQMKEKVSRAGNNSMHHLVTYLSLAKFTICFSYCTLSVWCIAYRIVSQHGQAKQSLMAMWPILAQTEKVHIYRKVDAQMLFYAHSAVVYVCREEWCLTSKLHHLALLVTSTFTWLPTAKRKTEQRYCKSACDLRFGFEKLGSRYA